MKGYKKYIFAIFIFCYVVYLKVPGVDYFNEINIALSLPQNKLEPEETIEPEMPNHYLNHFTLFGIDKNNNGVRDDVDIWISRVGKTYNERKALQENANSLNKLLIACDENNSKIVKELENKISKERACISFIFLEEAGRELEWMVLLSLVFNNRSRSCEKFYDRNSYNSTSSINIDPSVFCNFKVHDLENMKSRYENWRKKL
jgi:hypothetical protein